MVRRKSLKERLSPEIKKVDPESFAGYIERTSKDRKIKEKVDSNKTD